MISAVLVMFFSISNCENLRRFPVAQTKLQTLFKFSYVCSRLPGSLFSLYLGLRVPGLQNSCVYTPKLTPYYGG